jgi:hypothetical protein
MKTRVARYNRTLAAIAKAISKHTRRRVSVSTVARALSSAGILPR